MTVEATQETIIETAVADTWELHKPPTDLIFDDGEPLESNRHRIAMNVLIFRFSYLQETRFLALVQDLSLLLDPTFLDRHFSQTLYHPKHYQFLGEFP